MSSRLFAQGEPMKASSAKNREYIYARYRAGSRAESSSPKRTIEPKPSNSSSQNTRTPIAAATRDEYQSGPRIGEISTPVGGAADRYAGIDPTRGRGLHGVEYTKKVIVHDMKPRARTNLPDYHGFPMVTDKFVKGRHSFPFVGGDGKIRTGIEMESTWRGRKGVFQWIVEPEGKTSNHRKFLPHGENNQIPANTRIRGTRLARAAGRILLPVGLAADAYDVATADATYREMSSKVGAWSGSFATSGAAAKLAAPLLVAGPAGWVGYGAVLVGAGAVGYFAGGRTGRAIYDRIGGK